MDLIHEEFIRNELTKGLSKMDLKSGLQVSFDHYIITAFKE